MNSVSISEKDDIIEPSTHTQTHIHTNKNQPLITFDLAGSYNLSCSARLVLSDMSVPLHDRKTLNCQVSMPTQSKWLMNYGRVGGKLRGCGNINPCSTRIAIVISTRSQNGRLCPECEKVFLRVNITVDSGPGLGGMCAICSGNAVQARLSSSQNSTASPLHTSIIWHLHGIRKGFCGWILYTRLACSQMLKSEVKACNKLWTRNSTCLTWSTNVQWKFNTMGQ